MKIFVTGATGFIGRAAVAALQSRGHQIIAWVRSPDRARDMLGYGPTLIGPNPAKEEIRKHLEVCEAVLNLSGKPIVGVRWTSSNKKQFWDSRVGVTSVISEEIRQCQSPPSCFVSASAVGYYGDRGDSILTEESAAGHGYPSELCKEWENAALSASSEDTRVCILRLGIVLGREGGILGMLAPFFKIGIGAYIGNGRQYMPWIHLLDVIRIIVSCIEESKFKGVFNCTAPTPVRSRVFSLQLGAATNSRFLFRVPSLLPIILMGEAGGHLNSSQRVTPYRLEQYGVRFIFEKVETALEYEYDYRSICIERFDHNTIPCKEDHALREHASHGLYQLSTECEIDSDLQTVFEFFSSPLNLGMVTPSWLSFRIEDMPEDIEAGSRITYKIRIWGPALRWTTEITKWDPTSLFVDSQIRGPYKLWWHEHQFVQKESGTTLMHDRVTYRMPAGVIGRIVHRLIVRDQLERIFKFRQRMIMLRFSYSNDMNQRNLLS